MKLSDLILKRASGAVATAIPAISATDGRGSRVAVAKIATVAVANPSDRAKGSAQAVAGIAAIAVANPPATPLTSRLWLLHFPDREPLEAASYPPTTHEQILRSYPQAIAAEPFELPLPAPPLPMTTEQEARIRSWLAAIGEDDLDTIREVIDGCRADAERLRYFTGRAAELPEPTQATGCRACRHRALPHLSIEFCGSGRADLPLAYTEGHPLRRLPPDLGASCTAFEPLPF